jgi:hypothetical protein
VAEMNAIWWLQIACTATMGRIRVQSLKIECPPTAEPIGCIECDRVQYPMRALEGKKTPSRCRRMRQTWEFWIITMADLHHKCETLIISNEIISYIYFRLDML